MLKLLKKILDIVINIKETLSNTLVIILFVFSFLMISLFLLYSLKSAIGIDIFENTHIEDFFLAIENFIDTLF
jgi:hypothetical protein